MFDQCSIYDLDFSSVPEILNRFLNRACFILMRLRLRFLLDYLYTTKYKHIIICIRKSNTYHKLETVSLLFHCRIMSPPIKYDYVTVLHDINESKHVRTEMESEINCYMSITKCYQTVRTCIVEITT